MDRVLRNAQRLRSVAWDRAVTAIWVLVHWPYVRYSPRTRVAWSVSLRPTWSFSGKRLQLHLGRGVRLYERVIIQGGGDIYIGDRSFVSQNCILGCQEEISIGADVMIAASVTIRDTDHRFNDVSMPMNKQGVTTSPVRIEDDVWLGHGAVVLRGVTIGSGAVVAAQSVVRDDVPERAIVAGIPARVIKYRA
jgi:acetyltransferase-like isoleucine patch superfamily enzyme